MKKMVSVLLVLIMVFAADLVVFAEGVYTSVPELSVASASVEDWTSAKEYIDDQIIAGEEYIDLSMYDLHISKAEVSAWLCARSNIIGVDYEYHNALLKSISLTYESSNSKEIYIQFKKITRIMTDDLLEYPELSDLEKAIIIHDRLCTRVSYDRSMSRDFIYTPYCIVTGMGVCEGYSEAYEWLLSVVGVNATCIRSEQLNHAWNAVEIDGLYYQIDVTWDDVDNALSRVWRDYFFKSTSNFKTHHNADDYTFTPQETTRFDFAFWENVRSTFQFIDGEVYYLDNSNGTINTFDGEMVFDCKLVENMYYSSAVLSGDGENLYFGDTECIYKLDPSTKEVELAFELAEEYSEYSGIFDFVCSDGYFVCDVGEEIIKVPYNTHHAEEPEAIIINFIGEKEYNGRSPDVWRCGEEYRIEVNLLYSDGRTEKITEGYTVIGPDNLTPGDKQLFVNYKNLSQITNIRFTEPSFTFEDLGYILERGKTAQINIQCASEVEYEVVSSDASVVSVNDGYIKAESPGKAVITAKYTAFGINYEKHQEIYVPGEDRYVESISIDKYPYKTDLAIGEELFVPDLRIKLNYNDGSTEIISEGFELIGFDNSQEGYVYVTVKYGMFSTWFYVNVISPCPEIMFDEYKINVGTSFSPVLVNSDRLSDFEKKYASSDSHIAKISEDGCIEGVSPGEATMTVTVEAGGVVYSDTFTVEVLEPEKSIKDIYISRYPDRTEYFDGEEIDPAGMEITVEYIDGSKEIVTDYRTDTFKMPGFGDLKVSVYYNTFKGSFEAHSVEFKVDDIEEGLELKQYTKYQLSELFELSENLFYSWEVLNDGTEEILRIEDGVLYAEKTGTSYVEVVVSDGNRKSEEYIQITVVPCNEAPVSLWFDKLPKKTEYFQGESINLDGAVLAFESGEETCYLAKDIVSYVDVDSFDLTKEGKQTITIDYNGLKCYYDIFVHGNSGIRTAVKNVEIHTMPNNTECGADGDFDLTGLTFKVVYSDGSEKNTDDYIVAEYRNSDNQYCYVDVLCEGRRFTLKFKIANNDVSYPDGPREMFGDVTSDGKINIKDATQIQKFAAKLVKLADEEFVRADVNADTKVNIKDATAIQKYVAKLETGLPIGEPVA